MRPATPTSETRPDAWYERAAWIFFALISAGILPMAIGLYLDPASATGLWERFGFALPTTVAGDPAAMEYVEFISHWATTGSIGFNLFGALIAVTAFRRGERWAWLALCYWPVMFATHFVVYESGFRYLQLVWIVLSVAALAATYPKVWRRGRIEAGADALAPA